MIKFMFRASRCVKFAVYSSHADLLLRKFEAYHKANNVRAHFTRELIGIAPELISKRGPVRWEVVLDLLTPQVLTELIKMDPDVVHGSNKILARVNWDGYWDLRVRWHLKRKNFKRAWDAIKLAQIGFFDPTELPSDRRIIDYDGCTDEDFRKYPASVECVATLVRLLFADMVKAGLLKELSPQATAPDWQRLHSRIPGIRIADAIGGGTTAHKTLIIAAHFSRTRNANKRAKLMREIALA